MKEEALFLNAKQRGVVEAIIREHATIRGWALHAVSARSNHVHVAVTAAVAPKRVSDQFKANATRALRQGESPIVHNKI